MTQIRIGFGFDVHRYAKERPLRLCGLELKGEPGLEGHSDADVALHAVCDALYGAMAAGDLGEHFPDNDSRWSNAESEIFLRHAVTLVADAGYRLGNCDLTLIGDHPRILPHRDRLRNRLAALLNVEVKQVSVKATTTDGLGFCGRGEGLAATAVVLVERMSNE